jgi:nucleoid-associated protein Lsr2
MCSRPANRRSRDCNGITDGSGFSCGVGPIADLFRIYLSGDGMTKRTNTVLIDDLDGSEAEATVRFDLDGAHYEIDLNAAHAQELRGTLARYAAAARRARPTRNAKRSAASRLDIGEIRNWARENGLEVKERGRVSADLTAKYRTATGR